jgi:hypothetical protein
MAKTPEIDLRDTKLVDNLLINGRLNYWQRGTSASLNLTTATNGTARVADRFAGFANRVTNNQNYTWSQQADVPAAIETGSVLPFSIRCTANLNHAFTGEDRVNGLFQIIEGSLVSSIAQNQKLHVSFWFKSNIAIPVAAIRVALSTNGASIANSYVTTFSYTTANAWQKVSFVIDLPGVNFHTGAGAAIALNLLDIAGSTSVLQTSSLNTWLSADKTTTPTATNWAATSGNWVQFAGLSITTNEVANVPLAARNTLEELRLCQRYYEVSSGRNISRTNASPSWSLTYPEAVYLTFKTTKRATPLVTVQTDANSHTMTATPTVDGIQYAAPQNGVGTFYVYVLGFTADAEL